MATNTNARGNAAARVFAVPELLENILINLPPVEIYKSQMVDTTFNATISSSPQLHVKMHLEHADNEAIETLLFDDQVEAAIYPLQLFTMRCLLEKDRDALRSEVEDMDRFHMVFTLRIVNGDEEEQISRISALAHTKKDASWRKIKLGALGQKILVELDCAAWVYLRRGENTIVLKGGITFGELINHCVAKLDTSSDFINPWL